MKFKNPSLNTFLSIIQRFIVNNMNPQKWKHVNICNLRGSILMTQILSNEKFYKRKIRLKYYKKRKQNDSELVNMITKQYVCYLLYN